MVLGSVSMTYEKFEHKAIGVLLEGSDPTFQRLFDQFLEAEVTDRQETEAGFVVHYKVPNYLAVDDITHSITGVRVMLIHQEVLYLELVVQRGLIMQLNGTYTSNTTLANIIPRFSDLTFLATTQRPPIQPTQPKKVDVEVAQQQIKRDIPKERHVEEKNEIFSKFETPKPVKPTENFKAAASQDFQVNKIVEQEQQRTDQLAAKFYQEKAQNSDITKQIEQLFAEGATLRERIQQEQVVKSELSGKNHQLLIENNQLKATLSEIENENRHLNAQHEQAQFDKNQAAIKLEQLQTQNLTLIAQTDQLFSESLQASELSQLEQTRHLDLSEKYRQLKEKFETTDTTFKKTKTENTTLRQETDQLIIDYDLMKEELHHDQLHNEELTLKQTSLTEKKNQLDNLYQVAKDQSEALTQKTDDLLAQTNEAQLQLEQQQIKNVALTEKVNHLLAEENQIKTQFEQEKSKNRELSEAIELLSLDDEQVKILLQQMLQRNAELINNQEQLTAENVLLQTSLEQEQEKNTTLFTTNAGLLAQTIQNKENLEEIESQNAELAQKTDQLSLEVSETDDLLEQKQLRNQELKEKSEQLQIEYRQVKELLELAQDQNTTLIEENARMQREAKDAQANLSEEELQKQHLLSETERIKNDLEKERIKNDELLEKATQLQVEGLQISTLLLESQGNNTEFAGKVDDFKKSLEYFKFKSENSEFKEEKEVLKDIPLPTPPTLLNVIEAESSEEETPARETLVESQREKLSDPLEKATDNFLNKLFGERADVKKYRAKTKYHFTVWRYAITIGFNTLFFLLVVGALAIIMLSLMQQATGEPQNILGFSANRVVTDSMEPNLLVDTFIINRQMAPEAYEINQVATYWNEITGRTVTHRIYHIVTDDIGNVTGFILRGDANVIPNYDVIPYGFMIGQVVFESYTIGRILTLFSEQLPLLIIATLSLLLLLYFIKRLVINKITQKVNGSGEETIETESDPFELADIKPLFEETPEDSKPPHIPLLDAPNVSEAQLEEIDDATTTENEKEANITNKMKEDL